MIDEVSAVSGGNLAPLNEIQAIINEIIETGKLNEPDMSNLDFKKSKDRSAVTGHVTKLVKSRTLLTSQVDNWLSGKREEKKRLVETLDASIKKGNELKSFIESELKRNEAASRKPLTDWEEEQERVAREAEEERLLNQRLAEKAQREREAAMQAQLQEAQRQIDIANARNEAATKVAVEVSTAAIKEASATRSGRSSNNNDRIEEIRTAGILEFQAEGFSAEDAAFVMNKIIKGEIKGIGVIAD